MSVLSDRSQGAPAYGAQGDTARVSVNTDGTQGNNHSQTATISADGRYVTFTSYAADLVTGDTNGFADVFVHDLDAQETTRVSVDTTGSQGNSHSFASDISDDGRYVTFYSGASTLVPGDTNGVFDVFVHDRQTGETTRVSVHTNGTQGNGTSGGGAISGDGRHVTFASAATNLVAGDTNEHGDQFVHDRQTGETTRVSVHTNGTEGNNYSEGNGISDDGRYVTFQSEATNLVNGDTNSTIDAFVHDRNTGATTRVSVHTNGTQGNFFAGYHPAISANGRYVTFESEARTLVTDHTDGNHVFVHDRQTGETTRVSVATDGTPGNEPSGSPSISADGRYVTFASGATNLVAGDTNDTADVFVHDRDTGETTLVSVATNGTQSNGHSIFPAISADGRYVTFHSDAADLVTGDTNGFGDVFVHQYLADPPGLFIDDDGSVFENDIEALAAAGVTLGCNPPANTLFCPDDPVTRGQMSAFLVRALGYTVRDVGAFTDTAGSVFENDTERLSAADVTRGCNPPANTLYCPDDPVTRGQMAAFLVRALGYTDVGTGDLFTDADGSVFETDIDRLGTAGVTLGCNPPANTLYCPDDVVTRAQMAAFLVRALNY